MDYPSDREPDQVKAWEQTKTKVHTFLRQQDATLKNFVLGEPSNTLTEKLDIFGPPSVLVWDRDGKLALKVEGEEEAYAKVEAKVKELLQAK